MTIKVYLDAVSVIGPGADNWEAWRAILQNPSRYEAARTRTPSINVLPPAERRRIGAGVKLALACGMDALAVTQTDPASITTVFSSSGGDGENCHMICEALAGSDRLISPTRFHNSVHNAPSGYWGIASGAMLPSTSLCAYDASFAVGLLEAATQCFVEGRPVLYIAYDTPYPEPLHGVRPIADQFAVALLLHSAKTQHSMAALTLSLSNSPPSRMERTALQNVCQNIPAARSLPLLQAIAHLAEKAGEQVFLEYVNKRSLSIETSKA
ncbi:beta-ketoacyl synthase chain length factor [Oxalobacteraceae bacterium R-40]|uniref:Beta-ketoacyl synthase chain length factor n=1 Tax=Keguizhuia sedimenti TaxID=3064264 RepID=A0ABU1BRZ7_9BURK|nr:beta-ketoacyl synthase chain length factor [Oxalobacteraceae bacterium R-40]